MGYLTDRVKVTVKGAYFYRSVGGTGSSFPFPRPLNPYIGGYTTESAMPDPRLPSQPQSAATAPSPVLDSNPAVLRVGD